MVMLTVNSHGAVIANLKTDEAVGSTQKLDR